MSALPGRPGAGPSRYQATARKSPGVSRLRLASRPRASILASTPMRGMTSSVGVHGETRRDVACVPADGAAATGDPASTLAVAMPLSLGCPLKDVNRRKNRASETVRGGMYAAASRSEGPEFVLVW